MLAMPFVHNPRIVVNVMQIVLLQQQVNMLQQLNAANDFPLYHQRCSYDNTETANTRISIVRINDGGHRVHIRLVFIVFQCAVCRLHMENCIGNSNESGNQTPQGRCAQPFPGECVRTR